MVAVEFCEKIAPTVKANRRKCESPNECDLVVPTFTRFHMTRAVGARKRMLWLYRSRCIPLIEYATDTNASIGFVLRRIRVAWFMATH